MPITVNVGELLECDGSNEIRTRGCDPCVGLIVIYQNDPNGVVTKRCAHFSVGFAGPYTEARVNASLNPVLAAYFPLSNIIAVGFTWGGFSPGLGAEQICSRLTQYFSGHNVQSSNNHDSITTNGNAIQLLPVQVWDFTNNPAANLLAELNNPV